MRINSMNGRENSMTQYIETKIGQTEDMKHKQMAKSHNYYYTYIWVYQYNNLMCLCVSSTAVLIHWFVSNFPEFKQNQSDDDGNSRDHNNDNDNDNDHDCYFNATNWWLLYLMCGVYNTTIITFLVSYKMIFN